jgi:hypothetical protein
MMCGGGGGEIGGRGEGGDDSSTMQIFASIDHGGQVDGTLRPLWSHAPGNKAYNNQQGYYSKGRHR